MDHLRPVLLVFPNKTLRALSQHKQPPLSNSLAGTKDRRGHGVASKGMDVDQSREVSHNEVERKRKLKITHGIKQLSELLQETCSCGKQTRGEVLQNAVDKIKSLQEENEKLKSDIASLPEPGTEDELYVKLADLLMEHLLLRLQLQEYFDKQQETTPESPEEGPCTHDRTSFPLKVPSEHDVSTSGPSPIPVPHSQNEIPQTTSESSQHWSVTSLLSCDQQPMSCVQESSANQFPVLDSRHEVRYSSCRQDSYTHTPTQTHPHESHTHHSPITINQSRQHQPSGVIVQPWVGGSGSAHVTRPWTQQQDTHHRGSGGPVSYSHHRGVWRSSQEYQEEWQRTYQPDTSRHLDTGRHAHLNYRRHGNEMPHPYIGHTSLPTDPIPVMYASSSRAHTHGSSYLQGHMMSCDLTTPPYPLLPPAHPTSNSTVWRPYSEPHRTSGFCLADILSLSPHETDDTQQLHLEPTQTVSNKFLVDRLLDDI